MGVCNSEERVAKAGGQAEGQTEGQGLCCSFYISNPWVYGPLPIDGRRSRKPGISQSDSDCWLEARARVGPWLARLFEGGRSFADGLHQQSSPSSHGKTRGGTCSSTKKLHG